MNIKSWLRSGKNLESSHTSKKLWNNPQVRCVLTRSLFVRYNQRESNNPRRWSVTYAETKTAEEERSREVKAEWNSSGFNIKLNLARGNILCIYLHAQRQKRCVQQRHHGGAEVENSSFNSSALHWGRTRKALWSYTVVLVHLQNWQQSSKSENGCQQNWDLFAEISSSA